MCSCQHSCCPPRLHTCRVLCWTQGIKLGLIFCWIFLGRDWTWQQTGMSNRVMQRRAPGTWQHLGERPSAAGPGARAHHKFYSWATKHEETLLVQNHHKTNRPEVRTARENRRGRREGRIKLLQKPSNCTCKTFIWHYSWKSQSRFTKMSMDYSPLLWIQGINLFNASYCAWQWAAWMEIPMLELRAEEDLPQKPWGTWPGWAYHVEQVSMSSLWLLVPGISQHFELVSDIQTVRKKNVTDEIITFKYSLGLCSLALSWGIVTLQTNQLKRYSQSGDLWPLLVSQGGHTVTHALNLTWEVSRQAFQETLTKYSCVIWPRSPQTLISTEILCNDHSSMHRQRILVWERDLLNLATALKKKEKKKKLNPQSPSGHFVPRPGLMPHSTSDEICQ